MIRREICIYDKANEIIDKIQSIASKFDFSKYEAKAGHKFNTDQKYLIIKNLMSLYFEEQAAKQTINSSKVQEISYDYLPSMNELQAFYELIGGDMSVKEEKLGVNILNITRILSNGTKLKVSTTISTWLKNLGVATSGMAPSSGNIETNSGAIQMTKEQKDELSNIAKQKGYNTSETFLSQMQNIDNLKNTDGTLNGIMIFFTDNKKWIENNDTSDPMKYAIQQGVPLLVNPSSELIRATINNLNQNGNNIDTIYIESDPKVSNENNPVFLKNIRKYGEVMFDALFRPYSPIDSLTPKDRSEMYIDFQLNESKRHQNLAKVFNPIDRMEITKVMSNEFSRYLTQRLNKTIDVLEKRRFEDRDLDTMKNEEDLLRRLSDKEHGRAAFLKEYGAYPIFKMLHDQWQGWMNLPDRDSKAAMDKFRTIKNKSEFSKLSDEKIQEIVDSRKQIFSLVLQRDDANGIDNFAALFEEAALFIARKEKLKVDMNPNAVREADNLDVTYDEDEFGVLQIEDINSFATKEELPKDGWMINFRETSSFDSLSKAVRNIIDNIPLLDKDGRRRYYKGFPQYLDSNYVHALLIDKLHNIYDDEDVIPTLQAQTQQYPWLKAVIAQIDADNMKQRNNESQEQFIERKKNAMLAFSAFTHDMNKYFTPFWILKKITGTSGNFTYQTIAINRPEGTNYLFDSWRNSYESGELLVDTSFQIKSIYSDEAIISKSNAKWNYDDEDNPYRLTLLEKLYRTAHNNGDLKSEEKYIGYVIQHMKSVGINTNPDILKAALASYSNVIDIITQLGIIYEGIGKLQSLDDIDLLNNFGGAYQSIADKINAFDENAVESSARQGKKQYYSHTVPSYLGNFMKKIQNLQPNKKIPQEWIEEYENMSDDFQKFFQKPDDYYHYFLFHEFGRFDWFFHISYIKDKDDPNKLIAVDGRWMSDWIKDLYNGSENDRFEYVNLIKHKVMISFDGKEYSDWDPLSHAIILWNEFNSEKPDLKKQAYSYYHITTLSDANSAEFIRFKRYVNDSVKKDVGQGFYTYQELIRLKMHDLVLQEYNRIQLVKKRKEAFESDDLNKKLDKNLKIQFFDDYVKSIDDKEGSRGLQFNFLPLLNNYMVVEDIGNGKVQLTKFIDKLEQLVNSEASKDEIQTVIYDAIDDIMEIGFEDAMDEWQDIKLFALDNIHHSKYLGLNDSDIASNIEKAIKLIESNNISLDQAGISTITEFKKLIKDQRGYELKEQFRSFAYKDKQLRQLKDSFYKATHKDGQLLIDENIYNQINNLLNKKDNIREAMREYYWNTTFAESQIIEMFTTDLAFYKNPEDFVKRIKEIHAPNSNLNLHAKYYSTVKPDRGIEEIGRQYEYCVYVNDENIASTTQRELQEALDNRVEKGLLDKIDRDFILSNYKKITTTDGQGLRTFSSYRRIHIMAGDWTDEQEKAYWNIKEGNWNKSDFYVAYQTQKPYMFTQNAVDSGFVESPFVKSAIQHKNSEFMLAAMFDIMSNELGKNSKLKALNRFMEENDIDVIQFASCVKVGLQGAIDFDDKVIEKNHLNTEDDMVNYLTRQCFGDSFRAEKFLYGNNNPNSTIVHKINYADWGIQQATPEHLIDHVQLVGTQIRKLVRQDMDDNALIEWNGLRLSKKQWLYLFDAINTENILLAFQELNPKFNTIEEVHKLLMDEMKGNPRYTLDDQESIRIEGGQLVLPLCDPAKSNKIEALINSILRKRVTEQRINGGSAIQVTAYGTTDDLQIRWKDANGNFIFNEKEFFSGDVQKSQKELFNQIKQQFGDNYNAYRNSVKATSIAYVECYMPAVSKQMLNKSFPGMDYQHMDINNIPEEMRKVIGYRIPTENKYSMLPLYIKGFMPQQNGSTIMLPNDWVNQSGSDFDVDKLYLMLQSSENPRSLKKANYKFTDEVNDRVKGTLDFLSENSISNEEYEKIISQLKRMSKQQRDNYMIDLMYGVLTNETSVSSQTRPGNFDTLKKDAFIFDILENVPNKKIFELIKQKFPNKSNSEILNNLFDYLQKFTDKELEKLAEQYKRFNNLLSPTSQLYFHNQNMAGLTLVGIYANGTSHHALMQDQGLMLSDNVDITINGHKARYFDKVRDFYGNLISTNLAEPQAASVDNIKNPVLARLNQNRFTANIMPTLLRLGYSLHDINLFLKQPSIVRITTSYLRGDGQIDTIIEEVRQEYQDYDKGLPDISKTETKFSNNFLAKQLLIAKDDKIVNNNVSYVKMYDKDGNYIGEMEDEESSQNSLKHLSPDYENYEDVISYYKNQIAIIDMFKEVYKASNAMTNLVQCTRSDTQSGGAGPMIADTESKIYKWEQILDDPTFCIKLANDDISQLQKTDMLNQYNSDNENDELRFNLYNSKLPFLQAFYTFGLEGSRMMFGKYFPLLQKPFIQMVKQMQQLTKYNIDADTLKDLYDAFFDYCATSTNFFGEQLNEGVEKRQYFIRNFPDDFKKMVNAIPELEKNEFILRLKVNFADNTYKNVAGVGGYSGVKVIQFRNVGLLTAFQKDKYIRYWEDMLYRSNPAILVLAENLFRYSFYRHGFKFGPTSFMHLCPTAVKTSCPEYVQFLRNMTNEDWIKDNITYSDYYESPNELLIEDKMPNDFKADGMKLYTGNFADQYIRNNMNNYKFVVQNIVPQLIRNNKKQQNNLSSIDFIGKNRFGKDVIKYTVTLTIPSYNQLTIQDKRLIKLVKYDDDGNEIGYELMPYFSVRIANELVYYKAEQPSSEGVATYHRVFPLGYPNQFIEYDLTASPDSMESIFWFQNWKGIKVKREIAEDIARRKQQPIDISKGNQNERNVYDEMVNHAWQNDYVQEQQTVPQPMEESLLSFNEPRQSDTDEWDRAMFDDDSDSEEMKRLYDDVTQPIFVEDSSDNYRNRTIKNAKADATIAFAIDFNSAGEKLTKKTVLQLGKKYIPIDTNNPNITEELVNHIVNELNSVNAKTLNIAGNGIYTIRGKYTQEQVDEYVYELLNRVLNHPNLINKIENIRSGGQTGYDEAGIKAAMRLGIENGILAPKGWKFRNVNGVDISDEHAFKARFNYTSTKSGIKIVSDISVDKDQMNKDNTCKPTA